MNLTTAIVMTPEYLDQFAEKVSDRVMEKMQPKLEEKSVGVKQVAKHFGISEEQVRRLVRSNRIPFYKKPGLPCLFFISELNEHLRQK